MGFHGSVGTGAAEKAYQMTVRHSKMLQGQVNMSTVDSDGIGNTQVELLDHGAATKTTHSRFQVTSNKTKKRPI